MKTLKITNSKYNLIALCPICKVLGKGKKVIYLPLKNTKGEIISSLRVVENSSIHKLLEKQGIQLKFE
jgi:hypothetical protein